ncbi:MAG: phosphatidylserine/phosphatidylglycerophosphate/cardiolipin synthase family protein [Candidatus Odinarchaeota archaeon]
MELKGKIKVEEESTVIHNEEEIPPHWRVRDYHEVNHPDTTRVIAIGAGDDRFKSLLLSAINSARETLMLSSFILSDEEMVDALLEASARKVRCYLLFATETMLSKEYREELTDYDQKTVNFHKAMLDKLAGRALARTSDHLHAKYLLIDPGTANEKGFVSTANFTKEALERNPEIGVVLTREEIAEAYDFFRKGFWEESNRELIREGHWDSVKKVKITSHLPQSRITTTSTEDNRLRDELLNIINEADKKLIVSTYGFELEHEVVQTLVKKSRAVETVVLTRPREKNYSTLNALLGDKAKIIGMEYLHAKFVLDPVNNRGVVMTANIEPRGLDTGYEIGIRLEGKDTKELEEIVNRWSNNASMSWERGARIQELEPGKIKLPNGSNLEEKEIIEELSREVDVKRPQDLLDMRRILQMPLKDKKGTTGKIPKRTRLQRRVIPPVLPKEAVQISEREFLGRKSIERLKEGLKFPVPVYKLKNRYYGVVKTWEELNKVEKDSNLPNGLSFVIKS